MLLADDSDLLCPGIYLTVSKAAASVAVIITVLIMKLHHCSPKQWRVPKWVRIMVLGILAMLCAVTVSVELDN